MYLRQCRWNCSRVLIDHKSMVTSEDRDSVAYLIELWLREVNATQKDGMISLSHEDVNLSRRHKRNIEMKQLHRWSMSDQSCAYFVLCSARSF